jgi:hypothetical protein
MRRTKRIRRALKLIVSAISADFYGGNDTIHPVKGITALDGGTG